MTMSIVIGGDQHFHLGSNKGYGDFVRWVQSIPTERSPLASHLIDWGWVNDLGKLEIELEVLIKTDPPFGGIKGLVFDLMTNIRLKSPEADTILITNGLSSEDDPEGAWYDSEGKPTWHISEGYEGYTNADEERKKFFESRGI